MEALWATILFSGFALEVIIRHGKKSESVFRQIFRQLIAERPDIAFISLPSTSPANAAWNFEKLASAWRQAFLKAGIPLADEAASELRANKKAPVRD